MNLDLYKEKIKGIAEKYDLSFVILFGSQARCKTHPKSDIDIAFSSKNPLSSLDIVDEFYDIFKRDDVEVVNVGNIGATLMKEIAEDGKILYEKNHGDFFDWKIYASKIWMETHWIRNLRDNMLKKFAKS